MSRFVCILVLLGTVALVSCSELLGPMTCALGIPFARPPIGSLRWMPPQPLPAEQTTPELASCDTQTYKPACPQAQQPFAPWLNGMSEDCLYLNVFSAHVDRQPLPVMVFIYGGNFVSGTASIPLYNGVNLANVRNLVVVTFNYRLGALGFLALDSLMGESDTTGNYGLLDQIAALQWVQKNIAKYGGDPGNVTVFGESAGAISICALSVSPLAEGLFQRVIMESGACADVRDLKNATGQGDLVAAALKCSPSNLTCLRGQIWQDVYSASLASAQFQPVIDGHVLSKTIFELLKEGQLIKSISAAIVGTNRDEGTLFFMVNPATRQLSDKDAMNYLLPYYSATDSQKIWSLYRPLAKLPPNNTVPVTLASIAVSTIYTDSVFRCPSYYVAMLFSKSVPTYRYLFSMVSDCSFLPTSLMPLMGAFHSAEIPYVFNTPPSLTCQRSIEQLTVTERMNDYWGYFAHGKRPTSSIHGGGVNWVLANTSKLVKIDVHDGVIADNDAGICAFWNKMAHYV